MVTRIYHPIQTAYQRHALGKNLPSSDQSEGQSTGGGFNLNQQSRGLATVQEQMQTQKIELKTILRDFNSTMDAIGATDPIQKEVHAYLHVIDLQSQKERPSVPLIKQSLRTAADSLDTYITGALGQPSRVVRDWVDALLLQNIHFGSNHSPATSPHPELSLHPENVSSEDAPVSLKTTTSPDASPETSAKTLVEAPTPTETNPPPSQSGLSPSEKSSLKRSITKGHKYFQDGKIQESLDSLEESIKLLRDKNRPDLEGKVLSLIGNYLDEAKQPKEALKRYGQAAQKFKEADQPQKQKKVLYTMGSILDEHGQFKQAEKYYQKALHLAQNTEDHVEVARLFNDLGSVSLLQKDAQKAINYWKKAYTSAKSSAEEGSTAGLLSEILSNQGQAYRQIKAYPKAYQAYQASLKTAVQQRHIPNTIQGFENLASLFLEMENSQQADHYLNQANSLKSRFLTR